MSRKIVIIGGGFAGMNLAKKLAGVEGIEVVLVDRNNYNFFPPLIYQVASAFIEPSNISYPFRKMFQGKDNIRFYRADFLGVDTTARRIQTDHGALEYDYLVFAQGTKTNYFGLPVISEKALPLKNIEDALRIRNTILARMEQACKTSDPEERRKLLTFVIAGGGPTGVELSGMLSEMNRHIRKKDYPELTDDPMHIHLVDAAPVLLGAMSGKSQEETRASLAKLGVNVRLSAAVKDYKDEVVYLSDEGHIVAGTLIWVSGVTAHEIKGLPAGAVVRGGRIAVDEFNRVKDTPHVFAVGDICYQDTDRQFPNGHPQVAQVAIQQAVLLAKNFKNMVNGKTLTPFRYTDKGSLAIISKYKAVADLPVGFYRGILAWWLWLFIHILPIAGFRNKVKLLSSWLWNYISNDPTLRLIIPSKDRVA
ncbi:NADH dehydrogenase-like protein [compost metagenome]